MKVRGDDTFRIHDMSDINGNDPDYQASTVREDDTISLLDLLAVIAKRKWLIIGMTAIVAILTLAFLISTLLLPSDSKWNYLPNKYKPTVKILLQDTSASSSLSSVLSQSGLSSLSGLIGLSGLTGRSSSADLAQALLKSKPIEDGVADKFDFMDRYKITKNPKTAARSIIESALKMKYDAPSGILEIGYEDIDRVFATEVINDLADRLQDVFKSLTLDKVETKKAYLEDAIASAEKDVAGKSQQLVDFQNKYQIYDLTSQAQANIKAVADLQAQLRLQQIDLEVQRKRYPETDSHIVLLKDEISQLQKQIELMNAGGSDSLSSSVPLSKMAQVGVEYLNLQRDVQVQQAILSTLKQQYEMARLEEMDTSQTFQVLEKAEVPEVRSAPSRSKTAIIATVAGFFVSVLLAFILEYFERARRDPVEAKKLAQISSMLALRKKPRQE
jgi:uncharacterized protein involved in exopolysaccharide biosynthesis